MGTPLTLSGRVTFSVWVVIFGVSLPSLCFFYSRGFSNLYGDGIAHMEGARRLTDSLSPGYPEIGSVWLPLSHIVAAPLATSDFLWRTGLAGSIVSTTAFCLTAWLVFRLALDMNRNLPAGIVALAGFLLCPNMLYLASTPLTEPLALLWTVLVVYALFRFQESRRMRPLIVAAIAEFLGTLTRYDAWYVLPFATLFVALARTEPWPRRFRHAFVFALIGGFGPLLWILHNAYRFGNPLDFYSGPFSAKAIYAHQLATTAFPYPTDGHLGLSVRYYFSDLKLVIGFWPLILATFGLIAGVVDRRERVRRSAALLLLVPLPFYIHALAYAAIPLYVPTQFPGTYYNLRYGLEMLGAAVLLPSFWLGPHSPQKTRKGLMTFMLAVLAFQAISTLARGAESLAVLREGILNTPCKQGRQQAAIRFLRHHYDGKRVLMALGKWPCVMPQVGIYYRDTLTEANRDYWARLRSDPQAVVEWIIRGDGDAVDELMRAYPEAFEDFQLMERATVAGEAGVLIYRRRSQESLTLDPVFPGQDAPRLER